MRASKQPCAGWGLLFPITGREGGFLNTRDALGRSHLGKHKSFSGAGPNQTQEELSV